MVHAITTWELYSAHTASPRGLSKTETFKAKGSCTKFQYPRGRRRKIAPGSRLVWSTLQVLGHSYLS